LLFTINSVAACARVYWAKALFDSFFEPFFSVLWQNHRMIYVYGIPNCDTVKKARAWLNEQGLAYAFHDFKKQGVPEEALANWAQGVGWDKLINRQGTTWRKLDAAAQASAATPQGAQKLALSNPSVIKRPVVQWPHGDVTVGFNDALWAEMAGK
jgi:arsenate reductase (glutaredoxin)